MNNEKLLTAAKNASARFFIAPHRLTKLDQQSHIIKFKGLHILSLCVI